MTNVNLSKLGRDPIGYGPGYNVLVTGSRSRILRALLLLVLVLVAHPTLMPAGHPHSQAATPPHHALAFDADSSDDDDADDCACLASAMLIITTLTASPAPPAAHPMVAIAPDARVPLSILDSTDHPPRIG